MHVGLQPTPSADSKRVNGRFGSKECDSKEEDKHSSCQHENEHNKGLAGGARLPSAASRTEQVKGM